MRQGFGQIRAEKSVQNEDAGKDNNRPTDRAPTGIKQRDHKQDAEDDFVLRDGSVPVVDRVKIEEMMPCCNGRKDQHERNPQSFQDNVRTVTLRRFRIKRRAQGHRKHKDYHQQKVGAALNAIRKDPKKGSVKRQANKGDGRDCDDG